MPSSLLTGLISYWRLNEASGAVREDTHGTNDLTPSGVVPPGQITGKVDDGGFAANFATPSGVLFHIDNTDLSTGDIDFTIAGWFYISDKTAVRHFVARWKEPGNQREYQIYYSPGNDRININVSSDGSNAPGVAANGFGSPPLNTWFFIVAWHDSVANTLNIQINNGSTDGIAHSAGVLNSTAQFQLGASTELSSISDFYHKGRIDAVGFWKKVLTSTERAKLYCGGHGKDYPFPLDTEIIHTIKPIGGGDYTSVQSWEAAEQRDLRPVPTGCDEIEVAEVYSGGNAGDNASTFTIDGWSTTSNRYPEIRGAEGHWHQGQGTPYTTNRAYIDFTGTGTDVIISKIRDFRLTKMQVIRSAGVAGINVLHYNATALFSNDGQIICDKCIFVQETNHDCVRVSGGGQRFEAGVTQDNTFKNCLIFSRSTGVVDAALRCVAFIGGGLTRLHHNTIIAKVAGNALATDGVTGHVVISRNNYLRRAGAGSCYLGLASNFSKGGADSTNNAEAIHFRHRNIPFSTVSFENVASGSEDLHIITNASGLYRAASNIGQAVFGPTNTEFVVLDDFEGDVRVDHSGIFAQAEGSGGAFDVGMDQIPNTPTPGILGGYTKGLGQGPISGFIGGFVEGGPHPGPSGFLGGFLFAKALADHNKAAMLGGFLKAQEGASKSASIGGFVLALGLLSTSANIGGLASGLLQKEAIIGGFALGEPLCREFTELHARTLVKARSIDVVDQDLNLDCMIIFKGRSNKDFNAQFIWFTSADAEFNAKFKVEKHKTPPLVEILSVIPPSGAPGSCIQVTVVASGTLGDGQEWTNAYIDFGEPFKSTNPRIYNINMSISGFSGPPPWTAYHDYCSSGKYIVTARGQDNLGMVGMDAYRLNLASGLPDNIIPTISISGVPRFGEVPDSVKIDFTTITSGVMGDSQSTVRSPSDNRILWNFGNREISQKKNPYTYYQSPGFFVPTLRFLYITPSGQKLWVSDSLLIGFNK